MKSILSALVTGMSILLCHQEIQGQQISPSNGFRIFSIGKMIKPLPSQFDGMTNTDVYPGLWPAAVYRVEGNKAEFACVGSVFQSGPTNLSIILPEHAFLEKFRFKGEYGVRLARPDSAGIIGFIDTIQRSHKGFDAAVATMRLGTNGVNITDFYSKLTDYSTNKIPAIIPSSTVIMEGKEVKTLRSLITGEEANIIGYGVSLTPKGAIENQHRYVAIEGSFVSGQSGSAYFDQDKRIFIMHAGTTEIVTNLYFLEKYGRPIKGVGSLDGPLLLVK